MRGLSVAQAQISMGCVAPAQAQLYTHRLMVGLLALQLWHLPPVGCFLKKSPIVSIMASSVCAVMHSGLRGPLPARRQAAGQPSMRHSQAAAAICLLLMPASVATLSTFQRVFQARPPAATNRNMQPPTVGHSWLCTRTAAGTYRALLDALGNIVAKLLAGPCWDVCKLVESFVQDLTACTHSTGSFGIRLLHSTWHMTTPQLAPQRSDARTARNAAQQMFTCAASERMM